MMICAAVATMLLSQTATEVSIADYFPLATGTTWVYEDSQNGIKSECTEKVGKPQRIGSFRSAFPIISTCPGEPTETNYYAIADGWVKTVAYLPTKPLKTPIPTLTLPGKGSDWTYSGEIDFARGTGLVDQKGKVQFVKSKKVLGKNVAAIQVDVVGSVITPDGSTIKTTLKAFYGQGIGLIESESIATVDSFKAVRTRKLIKFENGSGE